MKKQDYFFILGIILLFLPFFVSDLVFIGYDSFNKDHAMISSFLKFAVLATLGEVIGLRIRKGVYNEPGFGILPRAIVWGFLGLTIKLAFVVFASGVPVFLQSLGFENATAVLKSDFTYAKLLVAFAISSVMNIMYAPVMMTFHKITDHHIIKHGGGLNIFTKKLDMAEGFRAIDWKVQWSFVFRKTIPFFWIPAHTITFLLPSDYQVLFAAVLGIVLGLILAYAAIKPRS